MHSSCSLSLCFVPLQEIKGNINAVLYEHGGGVDGNVCGKLDGISELMIPKSPIMYRRIRAMLRTIYVTPSHTWPETNFEVGGGGGGGGGGALLHTTVHA